MCSVTYASLSLPEAAATLSMLNNICTHIALPPFSQKMNGLLPTLSHDVRCHVTVVAGDCKCEGIELQSKELQS